VKVVVLTTSYPRWPGDAAGRFVADAVEHVRARRVEVDVVSPASFRHFGIAYGGGVASNLRRPWRALFLPAFLASFARAARRAARDADLVHAHWWPAGAVARLTGRPYIVQLWGTDVELARQVAPLRPVARRVVTSARLVICASRALADEARRLGARDVRVIPGGVDVPAAVGPEDEPPHVLFAGRLSPEKGVLDLVAAANGLPLVVVGDGPLRRQVPGALGFLPHDELGRRYERAAVVACPSRREGFGVVAAEAMAHGRPVVASAVGGLLDLVAHEKTGLLVPPGDVKALRLALLVLLGNADVRRRLGEAARERARAQLSWDVVIDQTLEAYDDARMG
jgi:glycosyltransferase involved in cell wall biosynthesis